MITKEEFTNISRLNASDRYKYFIKRVADMEKIYTLSFNKEIAIAEVNGKKLISIWSAKEYAEVYAIHEWENYEVTEFDLDEFEDVVGKLVIENGYLVNVFSIANKSGFVVSWDELWRDLDDELEQYS